MNRDDRKVAKTRLGMFLSPMMADSVRISRQELAGYLSAALDQIDDDEKRRKDDEGLMRLMLADLDPDEMSRFGPVDWGRAMKLVRDALRARLGEAPATEPEEDHDAD